MNNKLHNNWHILFLALLCAGLVVFKWEALHLPFFWDEAWVYMPAIRTMAEQGPSIMPASIDADLYTGHPLLFYFMASVWIKFWGYSLPIAHSLPLLISIALLISVYVLATWLTKNKFTGVLASLLVGIQPIFLAQSTYLLIEVWLGLLFVWSFYFYFNQKWKAFATCMLLALWSKESAFTLIPAFGLIAIYQTLTKQYTSGQMLKLFGLLSFCFVVGFSFFVIQKIKLGWYFFPRHANWINLDEIWGKFNASLFTLFVAQGRSIMLIITLVVFAFVYIKHNHRFTKLQQQFLVGALIFAFGFILFASINFFSPRYLFGALPLLLTSAALLISTFKFKYHQAAFIFIFSILGSININESMNGKKWGDVELSYVHLLKAQIDFTNYFTAHVKTEKTYAPFLMCVNLTNTFAGMVTKPMPNLTVLSTDSAIEYYVRIPNELDDNVEQLINSNRITLVKRVVEHQAWVELYKKNDNY